MVNLIYIEVIVSGDEGGKQVGRSSWGLGSEILKHRSHQRVWLHPFTKLNSFIHQTDVREKETAFNLILQFSWIWNHWS